MNVFDKTCINSMELKNRFIRSAVENRVTGLMPREASKDDIARPLLAEPDLINKWQADESCKPRCMSCNKCGLSESNSCVLNRK